MTTDFAGDPVFQTLITTPSDGELRDAASVQVPYSQLADRTTFLNRQASVQAARNWKVGERRDVFSGTTNNANAIAGNSQRWIAVGNANGTETSVATSFDAGAPWLQLTAGNGVGNFSANAITHDAVNDLFIFVGDGGNIRTGADVSFTSRASGGSTDLRAVHTSAAGVTIAAGEHDGSDIFAVRASDGITYASPITSPAGSAGDFVSAIASNSATFVLVGETSGAVPLIWRSINSGLTFSVVTIPGGFTDAIIDITYDGTNFVALGDDGAVIVSALGSVWAVETGPSFGNSAQHLAADPVSGAIVAIPGGSQRLFELSTDSGATWATIPHSPYSTDTNSDWDALAFDGTAWAVVNITNAPTPDTMQGAQSLLVPPAV